MKYQSDNQELRIATAIVTNVFNGIQIRRGDYGETPQQTIAVPVVVGTRSRTLRQLENNDTKTLKLPLIAVSRENFVKDNSRMHSLYDHLKTVPTGYVDHQKRRGVPINITFKVAGIAKFERDLDQMMTNFIPFFEPDVYVSWTHPKYADMTLKCQLVWNGDMNIQNPIDIGPKDQEVWQFETSFTFKTWIFAGIESAVDNSPTIKYVNTSDNQFFNLGDTGYGMGNFYAVPNDVSFDDFKEGAISGYVGDAATETVSYPVSAVPFNMIDPMLMCYPAMTNYTAATLKLTLIDEDRSVSGFDSSVLGFSDVSPTGSINAWYINTSLSGQSAVSEWTDDAISVQITSSFSLSSELVESSFIIDFEPANDPDGSILLSKEYNSTSATYVSGASFGSEIEPNDDFALYNPDISKLTPVFFYPNKYLLFWYKGRRYGLSVGGCINPGSAQKFTYGDVFPVNPIDGDIHRMTSTNNNSLYQYDAENATWFEIGVVLKSVSHRTMIQLIGNVTFDVDLNKNVRILDTGEIAYFNYPDYFSATTTRYLKLTVVGDVSGNTNLSTYINGSLSTTGNFAVTTGESTVLIPFSFSGQISQIGIGLNAGTVTQLKLTRWELAD